MVSLFETILYQPIFNLFVALYGVIPDVGAVIFILTVAIKGGLYPLTKSSLDAQQGLKEIQPKIKEVKEEYDDQQKIAEETMQLYQEHDVNPLSSCLPILIQIPVFLALYWVLRNGLGTSDFHLLYSFVPNPGHINPVSMGLVDLGKSGNVILAALAAGAQYFQMQMMNPGASQAQQQSEESGEGSEKANMMSMMNKQMKYVMPFMMLFIGYTLPAGVALYIFFSTGTTAIQHKFLGGSKDDPDQNDDNGGDSDSDNSSNSSNQNNKSQGGDSEEEEVIEGEIVD
ncbi:MAG: YidC/Oxa1 family membrane protein insertase [Candidatus Magasanikbacteria bacterium]